MTRHALGIVGRLLSENGGETRLIVNLARGLLDLGVDVAVYALAVTPEVESRLREAKVPVYFERTSFGSADLLGSIRYSNQIARRFSHVVEGSRASSTYLVAQDAALPVIGCGLPGIWAYLSQGDLSLLLLSAGFRRKHSGMAKLLSLSLADQIISHARMARKYDLVLANSRFTRGLISFLYDLNVSDVVYPPVDTNLFRPQLAHSNDAGYALAILRDSSEPGFDVVSRLPSEVVLHIVGGASLKSAVNLGSISDARLAQEYANASVTVSPNLREFYGYPLVESLSSGTPVVAFDQGGAAEIISHERNGWLEHSPQGFVERVVNVLRSGGPTVEVRQEAARSSQTFSIRSQASRAKRILGL